MTEYRTPITTEREIWDSLQKHPLQSWEWGEFRKKRQNISRLAVYENGVMVRGYQVIWTQLPHLPWQFGYLPMSGLPTRADIKELKNLARANHAVGIRMEPFAIKGQNPDQEKVLTWLTPGRHLFKPKTFWLHLQRPEEELLTSMHPKGRYNIKVAQKHEVEVAEDNSDEAFSAYLHLMFSGTAKRQKIYAHGTAYHSLMWKHLFASGMAHLFTARYQSKIIATALLFVFKDWAYYAYGASALEHKEVMAPTLLLWEIIKWSKNKSLSMFDMWGAEEGKGFTRFKEQFGPELVEMVGTYDIASSPLYQLFRAGESVRWKLLRIKK